MPIILLLDWIGSYSQDLLTTKGSRGSLAIALLLNPFSLFLFGDFQVNRVEFDKASEFNVVDGQAVHLNRGRARPVLQAAIKWCLIAYCTSSALLLALSTSIIRYL